MYVEEALGRFLFVQKYKEQRLELATNTPEHPKLQFKPLNDSQKRQQRSLSDLPQTRRNPTGR